VAIAIAASACVTAERMRHLIAHFDVVQKSASRKLNLTEYTIPRHGHVVTGVFTPVLAKHSKSFSLIDCISVGVDRMQRNFEPMRKQVGPGREVN
jgi:hypothetical protein